MEMHWRPMSEYPDAENWMDGPEVLFTDDKGEIRIGYQRFIIDPYEKEKRFTDGEWEINPIAWMPLPEAFKKDV